VTRTVLVAVGVAALVLTGCGDDGGGGDGDADLVRLLQDEGRQPEAVATCVADRLADEDVDRDELEAIIRGDGSTDTGAANAYGDATLACTIEDADPNGTNGTVAG
jgi:hypothetical protein